LPYKYRTKDEKNIDETKKKNKVRRISMSLPPNLLEEFNKAMEKTGFMDRSKAIQTAIYSFINENSWENSANTTTTHSNIDNEGNGAGAIILLYDNHIYNQNSVSTQIQHNYNDVISASTHLHLNDHICLESILVDGNANRIRELAKKLSKNRGIKSLKINFVSIV
jgi:CopG family transcriptional regulator, nickel-responsive regulator